ITIRVPAATYGLTLGPLTLLRNTIVIGGAGATRTVLTANRSSQVLTVASAAQALLVQLTLTGGNAGTGTGGGLANSGNALLIASAVVSNWAGQGGGI